MQAQITGLEEGKINDSYLLQLILLYCSVVDFSEEVLDAVKINF